jgi:hypothetical protein
LDVPDHGDERISAILGYPPHLTLLLKTKGLSISTRYLTTSYQILVFLFFKDRSVVRLGGPDFCVFWPLLFPMKNYEKITFATLCLFWRRFPLQAEGQESSLQSAQATRFLLVSGI